MTFLDDDVDRAERIGPMRACAIAVLSVLIAAAVIGGCVVVGWVLGGEA